MPMRDLTSRLRDIVRREPAQAPVRTLTYVADGIASASVEEAAEQLGGEVYRIEGSACVTIDRVWDATEWHGRRRVASFVPPADAPVALFDPRLSDAPAEWASNVLFFDLETTGLSGGAGTLPFLAGCGWFEGEDFRVRQFFLAGPGGERAMLDALGELFARATLLVTFNGRTFDLPLMETRWAFHRRGNPTESLAHFDMLPAARRLWRFRDQPRRTSAFDADDADAASCTLSSLERAVLGFHRIDDVPGLEIPARYFHFLRTGHAAPVEGVLDHNRYDLLSLAAVMARALMLGADGAEACADAGEQLGLGRLYERAGDAERARRAFELAAQDVASDAGRYALARWAELLRREGRHDEAAAAWQRLLDLPRPRGGTTPLERRAVEALAIHHEHRARDYEAAREYAETLRAHVTGRLADAARHRLSRLTRKLSVQEKDRSPRLID
jgi:uncharacterized protein YprB with RNaseH-like and TPR domain